MSKRQYTFRHLQPEKTESSEHLVVEDSYSVDEEISFGPEVQVEQITRFEQVQGQVQISPMARNDVAMDREVMETMRAIREGQNNIAVALQQLTGAMQQLAPVNRRAPSHHSGGSSIAGTPRTARTPTRNTDRPSMPIFVGNNAKEEVAQPATPALLLDNIIAIYDEWDVLPDPIKQNLTFNQYMNQKREAERPQHDRRPRMQNRDLKHAMNKLTLPTFDGGNKTTARAWIHKLDTYLTLKPMTETEAIRFATMHLEGAAYDWWHHGLVTQDHRLITSYEVFSSKLITRFDRKDIEVYYRDLAQLWQSGTLDHFIDEFQRISVMVPDMSEQRKVMLFTEGLQDRFRGLVKVLKPNTLDDAIKIAHDLDTPNSSSQPPKKSYKGSTSFKGNKK